MGPRILPGRTATGRPFRQVVDLATEKVVTVRLYDTRDDEESEPQVQQWTKKA